MSLFKAVYGCLLEIDSPSSSEAARATSVLNVSTEKHEREDLVHLVPITNKYLVCRVVTRYLRVNAEKARKLQQSG